MTATAPIPVHRSTLLMGACVAALLLLTSGGVMAQDNDDDGVLPGSKGGSGGSTQESTAVGLLLAGEIVDETLDDARADVQIDMPGNLVVVPPSESVGADIDTQGMALPVELQTDTSGVSVRFQGRVDLDLPEGADATLLAAEAAVARTAVIMVDLGTVPVEDYLDGLALPPVLDVVGDVSSIDLRQFRDLVAGYGEAYPGMFITWVFVSADVHGVMRMVAVRASTDGGELEIHIR